MSDLPRLVCASANPDKVTEIAEVLQGLVELVPRPSDVPDVVEDADTLAGNARLKAMAICAATGAAAVADDTGLFVDALGGAPGVFAARYAGEDATYADNCAKLLGELAELGAGVSRRAEFRTVALVHWPDGRELAVEGVCAGQIAGEVRPGRGFGYDSVFVPDDGDGLAFSQMSAEGKNRISHRGLAFAELVTALREMPAT